MADQVINPGVQYGARYVGPFAPGAGRTIDYCWPDVATFAGASNGRMRNNATNPATAPSFVGLGGGGGSGAGVLNGVPVWQVQSSGVAGNGNAICLINQRVVTPSSKNSIDGSANDYQYWRIIWIAAMFAAPALTGEASLSCIVNTGNTDYITSLNGGFGFQFLNSGNVAFAAVTGGALVSTVLPIQPAGGYVGVLHTYEMRIAGATKTQEASLTLLIDGQNEVVPATSASWAAGSKLPPQQNVGATQPGWCPMVLNKGNNVNSLYLHQMKVIAGPTFMSLF